MGDFVSSAILLIVNNLKPIILGCDWLNEHHSNINFSEKATHVTIESHTYKIPFKSLNLQLVSTTKVPVCSLINVLENNVNSLESLELLNSILNDLHLPPELKTKFLEILKTHWHVFSNKFGLTNKYTIASFYIPKSRL